MKFYKSHSISLGVFIISFIITWVVWQYTRHTIRLKEEALFLQEVQEVEDVIKYRLDDYIEALFGLRSLFATEEQLTRRRWNAYCERLDLPGRVPGMLSLRFDAHVSATEQLTFIEEMRADTSLFPQEFSAFTIFSASTLQHDQPPQQEELYVVTYIWPWDQYKELYGLDMFSIPERRRVIEKARDSGKPAISPKITALLNQSDQIPGFAVYLPVYQYGAPMATIEERRAAIQGVVAARFDAYDLIEHTLDRIRRHSRIDVEIFDGTVLTTEHLYYNDDDVLQAQNSHSMPMYSKKVTLDIYGQSWTLFFSSKPGFHLETTEVFFPWIALGTGIIISLLLTGTIFSLTTSQIRATQIAERMTKELEQQRAVAMRSDRLRSLGEMAAGIAHELNQPLVGVRGLAEHILIAQDRGWNMDARAIREKVATIVEQADRMSHIIEHVRIFAREAGKPELRPVNVNDVVESSTNLLGAQFASHGLTLEKSLAMDLPPVLANPFTLEEVVLNLLLNARDAVEERLQSEPDMQTPGVFLRTQAFMENGHSMVRIEIRDNGIGIPQEIQGKIFDPFFTTKAPDKGTGLGLSISKTILEEFRGTLIMTCMPEKGTTAVITLPAEEKYGTST
jgi:signal transduction histidine kinase